MNIIQFCIDDSNISMFFRTSHPLKWLSTSTSFIYLFICFQPHFFRTVIDDADNMWKFWLSFKVTHDDDLRLNFFRGTLLQSCDCYQREIGINRIEGVSFSGRQLFFSQKTILNHLILRMLYSTHSWIVSTTFWFHSIVCLSSGSAPMTHSSTKSMTVRKQLQFTFSEIPDQRAQLQNVLGDLAADRRVSWIRTIILEHPRSGTIEEVTPGALQ